PYTTLFRSTIVGILERAADTLPTEVFLILQPQTKRDELLAFLSARGYQAITLSEVCEGRRKYDIITAGGVRLQR
ncbi:MAG: tRNA (adenine(22)-N(1))-methyltransferase TrmK, partial [Oscillospiraceae bacterium]|nr:tRNA (adenine(22)-N(1))-methyltransferase TrmK [Oscillospiraceae bacterium]